MPGKYLNYVEKAQILTLIGEQVPMREIAQRTGRHLATIVRLKKAGASMPRCQVPAFKPIPGRPRKTSKAMDELIEKEVSRNPRITVGELKKEHPEFLGHVSERIIQDRVHKNVEILFQGPRNRYYRLLLMKKKLLAAAKRQKGSSTHTDYEAQDALTTSQLTASDVQNIQSICINDGASGSAPKQEVYNRYDLGLDNVSDSMVEDPYFIKTEEEFDAPDDCLNFVDVAESGGRDEEWCPRVSEASTEAKDREPIATTFTSKSSPLSESNVTTLASTSSASSVMQPRKQTGEEDDDQETDSAFCSYILRELQRIPSGNTKRILRLKIVTDILNAQQS